jgi:hypothetical protein
MTTFMTVDGFEIEVNHRRYSCTDNVGVPFPYIYIYGTERTPHTLNSACVPFLKRNTKGTERNTSIHHQLCDFGIQKVKMALSSIRNGQNK